MKPPAQPQQQEAPASVRWTVRCRSFPKLGSPDGQTVARTFYVYATDRKQAERVFREAYPAAAADEIVEDQDPWTTSTTDGRTVFG